MVDFSTYAGLQTKINDWLARPDLSSNTPDFIFLAENEFNQVLRVRQMEAKTNLTALTTDGAEASLPSDYLSWRRATWTGTPNRVLEYVQPDILRSLHPILDSTSLSGNSGIPSVFTIERNVVILRPIDTTITGTSTATNIEFDYYQSIPSLASQGSTGTNWLLTGFADCYLSGSLTEAYAFQKDYDQAAIWKQRRDNNLDRLRTFDQKTRGPSAIRPLMVGRIP